MVFEEDAVLSGRGALSTDLDTNEMRKHGLGGWAGWAGWLVGCIWLCLVRSLLDTDYAHLMIMNNLTMIGRKMAKLSDPAHVQEQNEYAQISH